MSASPIDHYALFDDVVAVARAAHAATAGWRAICVRAQRTLGKRLVQPIAGLDLDDEIPALSEAVRRFARLAPPDVDTLVFGLFDGVDDDGAGVYTGFHMGGSVGFDADVRWIVEPPSYRPKDRFLASPALDALARQAIIVRADQKRGVTHSLRLGCAALLARFASAALPHRVVVAFDDGEFAVVREPAAKAVSSGR